MALAAFIIGLEILYMGACLREPRGRKKSLIMWYMAMLALTATLALAIQ